MDAEELEKMQKDLEAIGDNIDARDKMITSLMLDNDHLERRLEVFQKANTELRLKNLQLEQENERIGRDLDKARRH